MKAHPYNVLGYVFLSGMLILFSCRYKRPDCDNQTEEEIKKIACSWEYFPGSSRIDVQPEDIRVMPEHIHRNLTLYNCDFTHYGVDMAILSFGPPFCVNKGFYTERGFVTGEYTYLRIKELKYFLDSVGDPSTNAGTIMKLLGSIYNFSAVDSVREGDYHDLGTYLAYLDSYNFEKPSFDHFESDLSRVKVIVDSINQTRAYIPIRFVAHSSWLAMAFEPCDKSKKRLVLLFEPGTGLEKKAAIHLF